MTATPSYVATTDITLKLLQDRRAAASEAHDWPAYHAFDVLIGCALGEPDMYLRSNPAVAAVKADRDRRWEAEQRMVAAYVAEGLGETIDYGMEEERRRHP